MAPPIKAFPVSELEDRVNVLPNGRRRKGGDIDLRKCESLELVLYECSLEKRTSLIRRPFLRPYLDRTPHIECAPVIKLFRRCAGDLLVETTAWECGNLS